MRPLFLPFLPMRGALATKQSHGLSYGYGIASSAFGLLAITNGAFVKVSLDEFAARFPGGATRLTSI
jgi:hypothetical protein